MADRRELPAAQEAAGPTPPAPPTDHLAGEQGSDQAGQVGAGSDRETFEAGEAETATGGGAQPAEAGDLPRVTSVGSGAALAAQLPYPDKFHAACRLAGAPTHDGLGLDDAIRLLLYALYRQAVDGPCEDPRPSIFDPVESAKHMAYSRLGKMNSIEAMFLYVRTLEEEKPLVWDGLEQLPETPIVPLGKDQPFIETNREPDATSAADTAVAGQEKALGAAGEDQPAAAHSVSDKPGLLEPTGQDPAHVSSPAKGRMPHVPRAPGALDAIVSDAIKLGKLPNKDASRGHLLSLHSDLKNIVRRMLFVVELLSNQADLGRKKREAAALREVLDIPTAADKTTGLKVAALVDCGDIVMGVIERELVDWTAAIAEELAAGPFDMIADRGAFAFKHLPQLAQLKEEWKTQMQDWEELKQLVPQQDGTGGLYSMLFSNVSG